MMQSQCDPDFDSPDWIFKLIRWKIVVHGGIDGKTRVVVYLRASNNNRADTVRAAFLNATEEFGWPSRVRADWGGENVGVQEEMEQARGTGRGSFFAGPSTHNQRIERAFWTYLGSLCLV